MGYDWLLSYDVPDEDMYFTRVRYDDGSVEIRDYHSFEPEGARRAGQIAQLKSAARLIVAIVVFLALLNALDDLLAYV